MMSFKNIVIDHFRGIDHLEVNDLKHVNVFLGQNNGGKTTLLESLFLLSGMSNPLLPERINAFRNKGNSSFDELKFLFHKVKLDVHPTFHAVMDNQIHRNLSLSIVNKAQQVDDLHRANQMGASSSDGAKGETCMVLNYETRKGAQRPIRQTSEFCVIGNGQFRQTVNTAYREGVTARFLSSYSETTVLLEEFSTLVKQNRKEEMLSLVKLFDKRITNIEVLFDGIYVKYQDIDEMLPLTMCGEGLKKFFNIIVTVANGKNNILLIDEIDNGVHFSAYDLLWKSLLELADKNRIQLFITTHSAEVVASLDTVLHNIETSVALKDEVAVFTIASTAKEGMQSYRYDADDIRNAIRNHIELRV